MYGYAVRRFEALKSTSFKPLTLNVTNQQTVAAIKQPGNSIAPELLLKEANTRQLPGVAVQLCWVIFILFFCLLKDNRC